MSKELIEAIIASDFVCANELFEEQLNILREQKLYEEKKRLAAKEKPFVQNTKADWANYRKQNPSVKWNQNKQGENVAEKPKATPLGKGGKLSASDIKARRKAGYLQAHPAIKSVEFIKAVHKHLEGVSKKKKLDEMEMFGAATVAKEKERAKTEKEARKKAAQAGQPYIKSTSSETSTSSTDTSPENSIDVSRVKKLNAQKMKDRSYRTVDRFQKSMERLQRLKAGGYSPERAAAKEAKLKQAYRSVRAKQAAKTAVGVGKKAYAGWGNVLSRGMSGNLE